MDDLRPGTPVVVLDLQMTVGRDHAGHPIKHYLGPTRGRILPRSRGVAGEGKDDWAVPPTPAPTKGPDGRYMVELVEKKQGHVIFAERAELEPY